MYLDDRPGPGCRRRNMILAFILTTIAILRVNVSYKEESLDAG